MSMSLGQHDFVSSLLLHKVDLWLRWGGKELRSFCSFLTLNLECSSISDVRAEHPVTPVIVQD